MQILDKVRHYYNVMGDLSHTNMVLKMALTVTGVCFFISVIIIGRLATRAPLIITILPDGRPVPTSYKLDGSTVVKSSETDRFIREFLALKYDWTPNSAQERLSKAIGHLTPSLRSVFKNKLDEDIAYIKNTQMTQKLHLKDLRPQDAKPFDKKKSYIVTGDRVIGIRGAKFTTDFKAKITLQKKRRNSKHLSGLFISAFQEIMSKKENTPPTD